MNLVGGKGPGDAIAGVNPQFVGQKGQRLYALIGTLRPSSGLPGYWYRGSQTPCILRWRGRRYAGGHKDTIVTKVNEKLQNINMALHFRLTLQGVGQTSLY